MGANWEALPPSNILGRSERWGHETIKMGKWSSWEMQQKESINGKWCWGVEEWSYITPFFFTHQTSKIEKIYLTSLCRFEVTLVKLWSSRDTENGNLAGLASQHSLHFVVQVKSFPGNLLTCFIKTFVTPLGSAFLSIQINCGSKASVSEVSFATSSRLSPSLPIAWLSYPANLV